MSTTVVTEFKKTYVFLPSVGTAQLKNVQCEEMLSAYASLCGSGMLASTLLISPGPRPVELRECLGFSCLVWLL